MATRSSLLNLSRRAASLRPKVAAPRSRTLPAPPRPSRAFTTKANTARPELKRPVSKGAASAVERARAAFRNASFKRFSSAAGKNEESSSLGARMKKLSREYGWSALGVYLALSALDFPFCYLLVRYLGTDRIGEWEHIIVSNVKKVIPESVKTTWTEWRNSMKKAEMELTGNDALNDGVDMAGWGVEEASAQNKKDASLATQLALAYAIHKSFIFIRVPLTAAVTPKVVKILRGWGWDIGKRTTKAAKEAKKAAATQVKKP